MAVINGTDAGEALTGTATADTINGLGGNDTINGLAGADLINGGAGNDVIQGGDGADTIDGGTGVDTLIGGADADTYLVDDAADQVIENANEGTDTVLSSVSYVLSGGQSVEILQAAASAGAINLTGNELANTLDGNNSNNTLDGGVDQVADVLRGGLGDDTYLVRSVAGGNAIDSVLENAGSGYDRVFVANTITTGGVTGLYTAGAGQEIEYISAADQSDATAINFAGNEYAQVIIGNAGANAISDNTSGNATIGGDTLVGLGGNDTYTITSTGTTVSEAAGGGTDVVNTSVNFSSAGQEIETITGTGATGLRLTGGSNDQTITGTTGADVLNGGGGNDSLTGGTGDDIYVTDGGDTIVEGTVAGSLDAVISSVGITLGTGVEIEQLFATGSARFQATGARTAGFGTTSYAFDTVDGTRNLTTENTSTASVPFLNGNATAQLIVGNAGDNILDGNRNAGLTAAQIAAGTNNGAAFDDTLSGLGGNDTYRVYTQGDVVLEDTSAGRDSIFTSGSYSLATNDTNALAVLGAGFYTVGQIEVLSTAVNSDTTAGITLTGNTYGQVIVGNFGDNTVIGGGTSAGGGTDVLIGLAGNDTYQIDSLNSVAFEDAGGGTDIVNVTTAATGFTLNAGTQVEYLFAGTGSVTFTNGAVTAVTTDGGTDTIAIVGNELSQSIYGNAGVNSLASGGGAPDTLVGGAGNDTYRVSNTLDTIIEDVNAAGAAQGGANGVDALYTTGISYNLAAGVSVELLSTVSQQSTENISLVGNNLAQTIVGNWGNNILDSDQGAVTGQGVQNQGAALGVGDTLIGLLGDDTYRVYSQNDLVIENAGQGSDIVLTSASYNLTANNTAVTAYNNGTATQSSVEVLSVASQISTTAGIGLYGAQGAQSLIGNDGANTLNGGSGSDTLTGRGGSDTFAFTTALGASNVDTISDFTAGDLIGLDNTVFGAATDGGVITADEFYIVGQGTQTADQSLVYNQTTGQLFYDADGSGTASAAVLFAQLTAGTAIGFNSFVVYAPVPTEVVA